MSSYQNSTLTNNPLNTEMAGKTVSLIAVWMCSLAAIFYCYEYYLRVAPSVMSAHLKEAFQISDAGLGHLSACFYYTYTFMQIPVGLMMDRFGPRKILTLSCALCVLGTYLFTLHQVPYAFVWAQIGRMLIGFGSAFAYVGVLKISTLWLPDRYFALMAGVATALGMIGAMGGEMFMGYLVNKIGWVAGLHKAAFWGIFITVAMWFFLRDKPLHAEREDIGPHIPITVGLLRLLQNKQIWLVGLIGCFMYVPISVFAEMWAIPYFEAHGLCKHSAAQASSLMFLGFGIGGPLCGILSDYLKSRRLVMGASSAFGVVVALAILYGPVHVLSISYVLMFLLGFCIGGEVLVFAAANDLSPMSLSGTAVSFTNTLVMVGGAVLQPMIGKMLTLTSQSGVADYSIALLVLPISLAVSACIAYCLKETY